MKNKKPFSSSPADSDPLCTPDPAWKSIVTAALAVAKTRLAERAIPATILHQQQPTLATAIEERPSSVTSMITDTPPPPEGILSPTTRDRILAEVLRSPSPSFFLELLRSPSPSSRSR